MKSSTIIIMGVVIFAVLTAVILYTKIQQQQTTTLDVPIPTWAISFGSPKAPVVLIELYNLHCPYCAIAHEKLEPLYKQLIENGTLRLVFLDLVHDEALYAHQLLHCAYKQNQATLDLISRLYEAYLNGGPKKQLELLQQYKCVDAPTKTDFDNAINELLKRNIINRRVTPIFIVIRDGKISVVYGADVEKVKSLLSQ